MHDEYAPPLAPAVIPAFAPVAGRVRRDGWTADRQRSFIAALARTGCVGQAAAAAGMSRESAYRLRRREGAGSFAAAWDSILAARPRGTSHPALVWHRLVRKAGGRGAVRIEAATPAEREALRNPGAARRPAPARKVTMKFRRAFRELQAAAASRFPGEGRDPVAPPVPPGPGFRRGASSLHPRPHPDRQREQQGRHRHEGQRYPQGADSSCVAERPHHIDRT